MMEQETVQSYDVDLEDGELTESSDDVYKPLQRPTLPATVPCTTGAVSSGSVQTVVTDDTGVARELKVDEVADSEVDCTSEDSSSGGSSDTCLKKINVPEDDKSSNCEKQRRRNKRIKRTVMVRVPTNDDSTAQKRARFKKYNVWTAALEEDALTENMRGCDVTQNCNDRNVENYDFTLRYRLNGENSLKRRLSNSTDDLSDSEMHSQTKRKCPANRAVGCDQSQRRSIRNRLGRRSRATSSRYGHRSSSATSGSDTNIYEPRRIVDLEDISGREAVEVAREMAEKLFEKKDDLLVRVIEVLGTELPLELYKETQRIEAEGGMMIKNGERRRTPGGVFLFLLKHDDRVTAEDQKAIFEKERQHSNKWRKDVKSMMRDRKVEELKKRLSEQRPELRSLSTRKDNMLLGMDLNVEKRAGSLSNPPPSPVGQEQSPDYRTHAINNVENDDHGDGENRPSTSIPVLTSPSKDLISYNDDVLDVNCGEMDF